MERGTGELTRAESLIAISVETPGSDSERLPSRFSKALPADGRPPAVRLDGLGLSIIRNLVDCSAASTYKRTGSGKYSRSTCRGSSRHRALHPMRPTAATLVKTPPRVPGLHPPAITARVLLRVRDYTTLLIVDDDFPTGCPHRATRSRKLAGVEQTACNALDILPAIRHHIFDGHHDAAMNGYELCALIRLIPNTGFPCSPLRARCGRARSLHRPGASDTSPSLRHRGVDGSGDLCSKATT